MRCERVAEGTPEARPELELRGRQKGGVRGTTRSLLPAARRTAGSGCPIGAPLLQQSRRPDREVRPPHQRKITSSPCLSKRRGAASSERRRRGALPAAGLRSAAGVAGGASPPVLHWGRGGSGAQLSEPGRHHPPHQEPRPGPRRRRSWADASRARPRPRPWPLAHPPAPRRRRRHHLRLRRRRLPQGLRAV